MRSGRRAAAIPWPCPIPWGDALWAWAEVVFDQAVSRLLAIDLAAEPSSAGRPIESPPSPDRPQAGGASPAAGSAAASGTAPRPAPADEPPADLDDDFVKLIGYSIVSVRRGRERHVKGGSQVVARRMTREAFVSWMIARNVDSVEPEEEPFLRVHFTVARRWPREPLEFEERQLAALSDLRRALIGDDEVGSARAEERP